MNDLLQAVNLSFQYPRAANPIVRNFSMEVRPGDFVGIVGPNGSGKSTLLKLLYGALSPDSGEVRLQGKTFRDWSRKALARKIAVVGQEPFWNFPITVHDFVLQGRYPYLGKFGFEAEQDIECVDEALRRVNLADLSSRHVEALSAGERQRMLLARSLAQQPEIFMLDEPTANLDLRYQVEVLRLMLKLQAESGFAVLLISHEVNLILDYVKRLILFKQGRALAEGAPEAVATPENFEKLFEVPFQSQVAATGKKRWIFPSF